MYPVPVMAGESVILRCLVWGTDQISDAVFYVNGSVTPENKGPTLEIPSVTESEKGKYKCSATFTYPARTAGRPYRSDSDPQDLYIYGTRVKHQFQCLWLLSFWETSLKVWVLSHPFSEIPIRAELSEDSLSCSCSRCPKKAWYRWYCKDDGGGLTFKDSSQGSMSPWDSGTYSCRAVWEEGRSLLSKSRCKFPSVANGTDNELQLSLFAGLNFW